MENHNLPKNLKYLFTFLNIVVGWHLLYEGIVKIIDPSWTSASYLVNATGIFSGLFQTIAENPMLLQITDLVNMIGLTIIGFCLLTGIFTRSAAFFGAVLLAMYYLANTPWTATNIGYATEGHYLIVNKNLVEIMLLLVLGAIPTSWYFGIGKLINKNKLKHAHTVEVPEEVNHNLSDKAMNRRALVKNLISLPFVGGFAFAVAKNHGWKSYEELHLENKNISTASGATVKLKDEIDLTQLKKPIPKGKLGNLEIGRIICGGNLISGFAHSRDLIYVSNFLKKYFTHKKVMDTFWVCEECGINATALRTSTEEIKILNEYWNQGGKMQWIAPAYPTEENYKENIDMAVDNGAKAVMIMGNVGDDWARAGKFELMAKTIDYIKSKGVPAGLAGHELATIQGAEEHQVGAEFYMKTLHSKNYWSWKPEQTKEKMIIDNYAIDNYWARTPENTIAYMESLDKPWIAFKILAAGAIEPKEGLRYAFENGADFACLGMFDFQIVENANILTETLENQDFNRRRSWMA